jgi:predicted lipoprotein
MRSAIGWLIGATVAATIATSVVAACTSGSAETKPDDDPSDGFELPDGRIFTRAALLEDIGQCIASQTAELGVATATLRDAAAAAESGAGTREDARRAWEAAIDIQERLELMQVGPGAIKTQIGGLGLRDQIYAWPLTSRCLVDGQLVSEGYTSSEFGESLVNVRGLGAIEMLLFIEDATNGCEATDPINADGTWAALDEDTLAARRAAYASVVAADVDRRAAELATAWSPTGGDFVAALATAGSGSATYGRESLALNSVSDALFYIEYATKDVKVARPAGLTGCERATCPELVESPWARRSKAQVRNNLVGLRMIFDGCNAGDLGFDEYLVASGSGELGTSILASIDAATAAVDVIEEPDLETALAADQASVVALHTALKAITDTLRTDFISVLDLEIPKRVEGDND